MIAANLKDIARYKGLGENLDEAIEWLLGSDWKTLPDGKHAIDGERIFAIVQHYPSKTLQECRFETHRRYIDIQMLASGAELMDVRIVDGLTVQEPYTPDIEFYRSPEPGSYHSLLMMPGEAVILFPEDAHRPCVAIAGVPIAVHKVVVKVEIS
jgi:YhcH/YjgK/YiaL family protein